MQYHQCLLPQPCLALNIEKWSNNQLILVQTPISLHVLVGACSYFCMVELKRPSLCRTEAVRRRCSCVQSGGICRPVTRSLPRVFVQLSIVRPHLSNMQRLWIELLPMLYDLPACDRPHFLPHFSPILPLSAFRICSCGMLNRSFDVAIVMQIVICHSHTGRNRAEILPSICNSAAQIGRCQRRCIEAFLPLARSYRVTAVLG